MSSSSSSSKMFELRCRDGEIFHVEETVVLQSETIKQMIEDDCANAAVRLPNDFPSETLPKVIEYIKKHAEKPKDDNDKKVAEEDLKKFDAEFVTVDDDDPLPLFDLFQAADYLNIESLFHLVSQAIADYLEDHPEFLVKNKRFFSFLENHKKFLHYLKIHKRFNITNNFIAEEEAGFTPEDEAKINAWALEAAKYT